MLTMQIGEWNFEVTEIAGRKSSKFGKPFTGTGKIIFTDGEAHIENLMVNGGIKKSDKESLVKLLLMMGYKYYISSKFIKGKRELIKTFI